MKWLKKMLAIIAKFVKSFRLTRSVSWVAQLEFLLNLFFISKIVNEYE